MGAETSSAKMLSFKTTLIILVDYFFKRLDYFNRPEYVIYGSIFKTRSKSKNEPEAKQAPFSVHQAASLALPSFFPLNHEP